MTFKPMLFEITCVFDLQLGMLECGPTQSFDCMGVSTPDPALF